MEDPLKLPETPNWDGKLVLAAIFILGYYALVLIMATRRLPDENVGLVRDAMLTLGPPIGIIFARLFNTTAAEERREVLRSGEVKSAIAAAAGTGNGSISTDTPDEPPAPPNLEKQDPAVATAVAAARFAAAAEDLHAPPAPKPPTKDTGVIE